MRMFLSVMFLAACVILGSFLVLRPAGQPQVQVTAEQEAEMDKQFDGVTHADFVRLSEPEATRIGYDLLMYDRSQSGHGEIYFLRNPEGGTHLFSLERLASAHAVLIKKTSPEWTAAAKEFLKNF